MPFDELLEMLFLIVVWFELRFYYLTLTTKSVPPFVNLLLSLTYYIEKHFGTIPCEDLA